MSNALLHVENLETAYGASQVLFGISLDIRAGEVATLVEAAAQLDDEDRPASHRRASS